MCKIIRSIFFVAQLSFIGYRFSFNGMSLFDRDKHAVSAWDRKGGSRIFYQDGSMYYDRREKPNIDMKSLPDVAHNPEP